MKYDDIYFAGLFDGEGCVTIDKAMKNSGSVTPVYRLTIQVAMIDRRPLDRMKSLYGGGVYKASWSRLSLSPAFRWCVASRDAVNFLYHVRPYLTVKGEEADVAITFQRHVQSNVGYRKRLNGQTIAHREKYRVRLQALKQRFRVHQSPGEP